MNNPDIFIHGMATRFGQPGAVNPAAAAKKGLAWRSVRRELKYLMAQKIDPDDEDAIWKLLTQGGRKPTVAQIVAATLMQRAMQGSVRAFQLITDSIEGKLPRPRRHVEASGPLPPAQINWIVS